MSPRSTTEKTTAESDHIQDHPQVATQQRRLPPKLWVPIVLGITIILIGLIGIHLTPLRFEGDPLASLYNQTRLAIARDPVAKANAHLAIAESTLKDFHALRLRSPHSSRLFDLANIMAAHDQEAMKNMDAAKQNGQDIKKLQLVKRLCGTLSAQDKELRLSTTANATITNISQVAEVLEDKVTSGEDLTSAMKQVKKDLDAAMQW